MKEELFYFQAYPDLVHLFVHSQITWNNLGSVIPSFPKPNIALGYKSFQLCITYELLWTSDIY